MAINEYPDVRCARKRHPKGQAPPAVGFVEIPERAGCWWPHCDACLDEFRDDPDPVAYDVAYLDPTRQRRPDRPALDHSYDPNDPLYFTADPAP